MRYRSSICLLLIFKPLVSVLGLSLHPPVLEYRQRVPGPQAEKWHTMFELRLNTMKKKRNLIHLHTVLSQPPR